jgi:hypothetical protein
VLPKTLWSIVAWLFLVAPDHWKKSGVIPFVDEQGSVTARLMMWRPKLWLGFGQQRV